MYQYQAQAVRTGPKVQTFRYVAAASEPGSERFEKKADVSGPITVRRITYSVRQGSVFLSWASGDIIAILAGQGEFDFTRFGGLAGADNIHLTTQGFLPGSGYTIELETGGADIVPVLVAPTFVIGALAGGGGGVFNMPAVPSAIPIYKSTQTTTVDEDTTVWTSVDIGTPHPNRVVILAGFHNQQGVFSSTVNGIPPAALRSTASNYTGIASHLVPSGTTATVSYTMAGALRKAVSVYVAYPVSPVFISAGGDTASGTTDAVVALTGMTGGFAIYAGAQGAVLGTFTTTWGGADAVVEDVDAQIEALASYTTGHINFTENQASASVTLAESLTGIKHMQACSFYPSV